jgi:hypothetical protein
LNGAAGTGRLIEIRTNNLLRWGIGGSAAAESGSNAGTDFIINRFDDAGTFLGQAVAVSRAAGFVGINQATPIRRVHVVGTDGPLPSVPGALGSRHEIYYENNGNVNVTLAAPATALMGLNFTVPTDAAGAPRFSVSWSGSDGFTRIRTNGTDRITIGPTGTVDISDLTVGSQVAYHAGNLSFGAGLTYSGGVLSASGGASGGMTWTHYTAGPVTLNGKQGATLTVTAATDVTLGTIAAGDEFVVVNTRESTQNVTVVVGATRRFRPLTNDDNIILAPGETLHAVASSASVFEII